MPKTLIVNADDFGRAHTISDGILKAHRDGIVTSATAMLNLPGAAQDLHRAMAEAPALGLGLHLVFTFERPLLPPEWVPSLIDEHGRFHTQETIFKDPTRLDPGELLAEFKAQASAFEHAAGRAPDHIDCHHFVHVHPRLFAVYHDLALDLNLPMRIPFPLDEAGLADPSLMPAMASTLPAEMAQSIARHNRQRLAEKPVRAPDRFYGGFFGENATIDYLLSLLDRLPDGMSELMTHPGYTDDSLSGESGYNAAREVELAVLTDPRVKQRIVERGIVLATFAAIA